MKISGNRKNGKAAWVGIGASVINNIDKAGTYIRIPAERKKMKKIVVNEKYGGALPEDNCAISIFYCWRYVA